MLVWSDPIFPRKVSVNPVVLCFIPIFRGGLGHCNRGRWPRPLSSAVTDCGYNNPDTSTGQRGSLKPYWGGLACKFWV